MFIFLTALSIGFLGSFHCVGMCGPIALALPLNRSGYGSAAAGALTYNAGRIITYAVFGIALGLAGKTFVIAGYQRALSLTIGAVLLVYVCIPDSMKSSIPSPRFLQKFVSKNKNAIGRLFQRSSLTSLLLIGLLNGLLPCGFVYLGLAGSLATGDAWKGAAFMAAFGAGTIPAMLALSLAGNRISLPVRNSIRKAVPVFMGLMALLFILRGLNLGIPYLSPHLSAVTDTQHNCCHK
jgi:hypothetical protein